jgi:hypothetical protein
MGFGIKRRLPRSSIIIIKAESKTLCEVPLDLDLFLVKSV